MKTAWFAAAAERRLARAAAFIEAIAPGEEAVLIGPSRGAVDDLVRSIALRAGSLFGVHRKTLRGFAVELAAPRLAHEGRVVGTPLAIDAAVTAAIARSLEAKELGYFGVPRPGARDPVALAPTFPRALRSTLLDVRSAGVDAAALRARDETGSAARLHDLARLLERYEAELASRGIADAADVGRAAIEAAVDAELTRAPLVLVDVPIVNKIDETFVQTLFSRAARALLVSPRDDQRMHQLCAATGIPTEVAAAPRGSSLERARQNLFRADVGEGAELDGTLELFSAPTQSHEAVEVVRRLLVGAKPGGPSAANDTASASAFDRIAIVIPSRRAYAAALENALRRAQIQPYFSFGTRRPHPAGRAFIALLSWWLERFPTKRLAEYFSLGQVPSATPKAKGGASDAGAALPFEPVIDDDLGRFGGVEATDDDPPDEEESDEETPEPSPTESAVESAIGATPARRHGGLRTPHRWDALIGESGTRAAAGESGRAYYTRRIKVFCDLRRAEREAIARDDPESTLLGVLDRDLADAGALSEFLDSILSELDAFPQVADWAEWLERLERLAHVALRKPELVQATLRELRELGGSSATGAEVVVALRPRLTELEERRPARRYGRVFVGMPHDLRGRAFDQIYMLGLVERVFPSRLYEDPLLFDDDRRALSPALPTLDDRANAERLSLELAVGAATTRATFSFPRMDVEAGRPRVPSFYALDLLRAVTGAVPDIEVMLADAAKLGDARLEWPAPRERSRALDLFEHDLATLRDLLDAPSAAGLRGRARYLLEENAHLRNALRARYARLVRPTIGESDGLVQPNPYVRAALGERSLKRRAFSASALQHYAACPLRFYLLALLGVDHREPREELETLDPVTRGELFHDTLTALVRALEKAERLPVATGEVDLAIAELRRVFDVEVRRIKDQIEPTLSRRFERDCDELFEDLVHVVRSDFVRSAPFSPVFADVAFGLGARGKRHRDPRSVAEPAVLSGGYLLRGAIDAIERSQDGLTLRVTDYKTGKHHAGLLVTGRGELLQPILYALAVESLGGALVNESQKVTSSRLFYATKDAGYVSRTVSVDDMSRAQAREVLRTIDAAVVGGFLPAKPRRGACAYCEAKACCGANEETRTADRRARGEGIEHVNALDDIRMNA